MVKLSGVSMLWAPSSGCTGKGDGAELEVRIKTEDLCMPKKM